MWDVKLSTVRNWIRRDRVTTRPDGKVDGESVYEYLDRRGTVGQHRGARQLGIVSTDDSDTPETGRVDAGQET